MPDCPQTFSPSPPPPVRAKPAADLPAAHAAVTRFLFPAYPSPPPQPDVCVILGSANCGYRVDAALQSRLRPGTRYLVSGGGMMNNGMTEGAFMAARLRSHGIASDRIAIENSSRCTSDNLVHIKPLLQAMLREQTVASMILVTAGFHMQRTLLLAAAVFSDLPWLRILPLPAYGPHTAPDNWHRNAIGRRVVAEELAKLEQLNALPAGLKIASA